MPRSDSPPNQHPTRTADEYLDGFRHDPRNAPLALYAGAALHKAGRQEEALAVWTLGNDFNAALRTVQYHPSVDDTMRAHSALADQQIRAHFSGMHAQTVAQAEKENAESLPRIRNAIWTHYHQSEINFATPNQRPLVFYAPDLPAHPIAPHEQLPWADDLNKALPVIRDEYLNALSGTSLGTPYIADNTPGEEWENIRGKMDWSAVYLYFNAQETDDTKKFPQTRKALENINLVSKNGIPMEVFYSVLKPGAAIPPHHGLTNTRLTVHLPLIIPDDCAIRISDETHHWKEGEVIAFDDTFEHEAWNKSDQTRVVLIFEVPHPDLTTLEQNTIERIYETFDRWVDDRVRVVGLDPTAQNS